MEDDKPIISITSLDDFSPADVDVRLEFEDHVELVPMKQLSYAAFQKLGWEVPNPVPPMSGVDKNARPVFDYNNPTYQQAVRDAETQRSYKRLLASLRLDVPGADEAEKIAFLQNLDANRMRMLLSAVGQLITEGAATVEAKTATFQRGRTAH